MTISNLCILGWGTYLPAVQSVPELIKTAGGDPTNYIKSGWSNVCVAQDADHPTAMCTKSLQAALGQTGVASTDLKLVICTSQTHDYIELATSLEVMKEVNASPNCVGFDIFNGCLATLIALELAKNWLNSNGGGHAAIISAERSAASIDRNDSSLESIWGQSDGSSALIVGVGVPQKARVEYHGTCFYSTNEMSGHMRRAFGGTQAPSAPAGQNPFKRIVRKISGPEMQKYFVGGYSKVIDAYIKKYPGKPQWLVANQVSPVVVEMLGLLTRIEKTKVAKTGIQFGHVGCSDIVLGLENLTSQGLLIGQGMVVASNPSCWGAAMMSASNPP